MSSKIDQRIVEMSFENHKFEKGINQSQGSLREFTKALNNMGTGKEFNGLERSVGGLSASFSMLEQIGVGALRRVGEMAINTGAALIKNLTIDPLSMGWGKYEEKTASVQTIMNATGKSIDEVNGYLEKLMWFSDETSYGFTDMTGALAQMTSSGGDIDTLIPLITGVANATAYAGKGATEFSRAMYNLNQSYGSGNLQYMDWRSLELAGVAGKDLKQIFIDTAIELGRLNENGETAKGTLVDIGTFGSTLQEKWADTRVMEKAFGKFSELSEAAYELVQAGEYETAAEAMEALSGQYSELAEKAFKSAQQAKSFKEAIDATLDAVSTGWMNTYEVIFGNLEEATKNFTVLTEILWTTFASGAEARNEMLKSIKDLGGIKNAFQTIKNVAVAVLKPIKAVSQAFDQIFPPRTANRWAELLESLKLFTQQLIITDDVAYKIKRTFAGLFAVIDIGWTVVKFLGNSFLEIARTLLPFGDGMLDITASIGDFLVGMNRAIKSSGVFEYGLLAIKIAAVLARNAILPVITAISEFVSGLWNAEKPLEYIAAGIIKLFGGVIDSIKMGVSWIGTNISNALSKLVGFINGDVKSSTPGFLGSIFTIIKDFVKFLADEAIKVLGDLGDVLNNLNLSRIATFVTGGILLLFINQLTGLTKAATNVLNTTNTFFSKFSKKLFGTTLKFKELAISIGILAGSLYILSQVPWDKMKYGLVGLAAAVGLFVAAYGGIQAITVIASKKLNGAEVIKSTFNLAGLAGGLAIMAGALKIISSIKDDDIWRAVGVLGSLMVFLTAYQGVSTFISKMPGNNKARMNLAGLSAGLLGLIAAVTLINKMTEPQLLKGIVRISSLLVIITGFQVMMGMAGNLTGGNKFKINLLSMSSGILVLIGVMAILSAIPSSVITKGIGNLAIMAGVLTGIEILLGLAGRLGGGIKFRTHILSVQLGLVSMVGLIAILDALDKKDVNLDKAIKNVAKMGGVIAAIEVLTAAAARLAGGAKVQRILGAVAFTMLSFTGIIGIMGIFDRIDPSIMDNGIKNIIKMGAVILAIEYVTALISKIPGTTKGVGVMLGVVGAILALTASLALLAVPDQESLRQAAISLSIAAAAISGMAVSFGILSKGLFLISGHVFGLSKIAKIIVTGFIALGSIMIATIAYFGMIKMASGLIESIKPETFQKFTIALGMVGILAAEFTLLSKIGMGNIAGLGPIFAGLGVALVGTVVLFHAINSVLDIVKNIDWASFGKFAIGLGVVGAFAVAMALIAPQLIVLGTGAGLAFKGIAVVSAGIIAGIIQVGLIIAAFAGLSYMAGMLSDANAKILLKGIDRMIEIGEGIGRFVGAMVGGFKAESLALISQGLTDFVNTFKDVDTEAIAGIKTLAEAMILISGNAFLEGIPKLTNLFGKSSMDVFADGVESLIDVFKDISPEDAKKASSVIVALQPMASALKDLADASNNIPNTGGLLGGILGNNDIDDFGEQLKNFIGVFTSGGQRGGTPLTTANVTKAASTLEALVPAFKHLKSIAKDSDKIPNTGGILGFFIGNNDIDDFGVHLNEFIVGMALIDPGVVKTAASALEQMEPMAKNLGAFVKVAKDIPDSPGLFIDSNMESFVSDLKGLVNELNLLTVESIRNASGYLITMSTHMVPAIKKFITLSDDLIKFQNGNTNLVGFATQLKTFTDILATIDFNVIQSMVDGLNKLNGSSSFVGSNIFKESLDKSKPYIKEFEKLGEDIVLGLRNGIIRKQNLPINAMTNVAKSLETVTRGALSINSPSKVFEEIGGWLPAGLGNGIKRNISTAALAGINMSEAVMNAVRNTLGIHSDSTETIEDGQHFVSGFVTGVSSWGDKLKTEAKKLGIAMPAMTAEGIEEGAEKVESSLTTMFGNVIDLLSGDTSIEEFAKEFSENLGTNLGTSLTDAYTSALDTRAISAAVSGTSKDAFQAFKESIDYRKEYNLITYEEELAAWIAFSKKYAEGTEIRMKADKEIGRIQYENSINWIDKEKYYKRLSLQEEYDAWGRVQARYKEGHEYRMRAERELFRLKEEIRQLEYRAAMDAIEEEKYYGRLNLNDELKQLKALAANYEDLSDERKQLNRDIFQVEKDLREENLRYEEELMALEQERNDKRTKLADDYYAKEKEIKDKLAQDIKSLNDEYDNALQSRISSLYSTHGLFDAVEKPQNVRGFDLINNLEDQVMEFDKWQSSITELSGRGINEGLIEELRAMGPKSLAQIRALNRMSQPELKRYSTLWQKKNTEIREQAIDELSGLRKDTDSEIKSLTKAAKSELKTLNNEWEDALDALNKENKKQLADLEKRWSTSLGSITSNGMKIIRQFRLDWFGEIAAMISDTQQQMSELQKATQISKVKQAKSVASAAAVGTAIGAGLGGGLGAAAGAVIGVAGGLVKNVLNVMKKTAKTNSPSKETIWIGENIGEGLVVGLRNLFSSVKNEGASIGQTALDSIAQFVKEIPELLDDTNEFTIEPVFDLSNVSSGMSSLLGIRPTLEATTTRQLIPISDNQNGNTLLLNDIRSILNELNNNQEMDLTGVLTIEMVNDRREVVKVVQTEVKDILRRASR